LVANPKDIVFLLVQKRKHMVRFQLLPHGIRDDAAVAEDAHQPEPRADPQGPLTILRERPDLHHFVRMAAPLQTDPFETGSTLGSLGHAEQAAIGANPHSAVRRTKEPIHSIRCGLAIDGKRFIPLARRGDSKANHAPAVRCEPEIAIRCFEQVVDARVRQAVGDAEALKLRAVKPADAAVCANPQQAARVEDDAMHAVVSQPVCHGEGANGQFMCIDRRPSRDQEHRHRQREPALHGLTRQCKPFLPTQSARTDQAS
jgi:hypothetical protein